MTNYMEDGYFTYDTSASPLTVSTANSSLQDLDPVLFAVIDFFERAIKLHAGSRWDAECVALGQTDLVGNIVAQTLPYDPFPLAKTNNFRFPLLVVSREKEEYEWKTISHDHITSTINVTYIMSPLESEAMEKLGPFLPFIARVLVNRTKQGFDTNILSEKKYWTDAGLEQIGMMDSIYGKSELQSNMFFPTISMRLQVIEREMPVLGNFQVAAGVDLVVNVDGVTI